MAHMKTALIYSAILFYLPLTASPVEPIRLNGNYDIATPVQVAKSWRQEIVDLRTTEGENRQHQLIQEGWACERKAFSALCRGPFAASLSEPELHALENEAKDNGSISFGAPQSDPAIFVEAETYTEFIHFQPIHWGTKQWPRFRTFQSPSLIKLNIVDEKENVLHAFVVSDQRLTNSRVVNYRRTERVRDFYLIEVNYSAR